MVLTYMMCFAIHPKFQNNPQDSMWIYPVNGALYGRYISTSKLFHLLSVDATSYRPLWKYNRENPAQGYDPFQVSGLLDIVPGFDPFGDDILLTIMNLVGSIMSYLAAYTTMILKNIMVLCLMT